MALSQLASNCSPSALPYPAVFGAAFTSLTAHLVSNYSFTSLEGSNPNHGTIVAENASFCNVTLTHTHLGQNDNVITNVWLPVRPAWNERLQAIGGGGWTPGLYGPQTDSPMAGAIAEGYATVTTNGGVPSINPEDWALWSPGNVNLTGLSNFASVALKDGVLAAKGVIESFYGEKPKYSYWSGCSQGGRQGYMFAQQYPEIFDGIAAAAPAIYWSELFHSAYFPQQVMNEMDAYPSACEIDALTTAAIAACDANDGVTDGIISDPDSRTFDPYALVGQPLDCPGVSIISEAAATVADAAWSDITTTDGEFLWYSIGYSANLTYGIAGTTCSANGTCVGFPVELFPPWLQLWVQKDPAFDLRTLDREAFVASFRKGIREFDSIIGTSWTDLREFRDAGGKLLTYHGLSDRLIPYKATRKYFDEVSNLIPDTTSFYRVFEAPGLDHCYGDIGGYPSGTFDALVRWVEEGVAPDVLEARDLVTNETRTLCLYPEKEC